MNYLQEVVDDESVSKQAEVIVLNDKVLTINGKKYHLVENYDSGFNKDKIEERYNTVLDKYDFIVGDWGYDQLRFKGFYEDKRSESNIDNKISHLEDYLLEYCNFGCAYFVLEKDHKAPVRKKKRINRAKSVHNAKKHLNKNKPRRNNNGNNKQNGNRRHKKTVSKFKIRKIGEENK